MSDIVKFHDVDFELIEINGERSVRVSDLASALGYADQKKLNELIRRNRPEFKGKIFYLKLRPNSPGAPQAILTYHGVIRAAMLSNAPRAKEFRDWAEEVLFKVMTTGSYNAPVLTQILNQMNETLLIQGKMVQNLAVEVNEMKAWRQQTYIPAPRDNTFDPTPTRLLKACVDRRRFPKGFNRGGSFDVYAAQRHALVRDGLLSQRNRRNSNKQPEYVVQDCPENRQFMKETFSVYMQTRWRQGELKLVASTKPESSGVSQ